MLSMFRSGVRIWLMRNGLGLQRLCVHNDAVVNNPSQFEDDSEELLRDRKKRPISLEMFSSKLETIPLEARGADTFGDLSSATDIPPEFVEGDEADKEEGTEYTKEVEERERVKIDYAGLISELLAEKNFTMALEILETQMKKDKAKPDRYIYVQLITFCGKVGYPQKAFKLFNDMKKREMAVTSAVYTSLFNACANCPVKEVGLKYAERIRDITRVKGFLPNGKTYNAMIKAFGRCEDLETAFSLADEMMSRQLPLDVHTMSFLLQSCISDKKTGFRHALLVWHKMRLYRIKPTIYSYNLMLRCVRDCGLGDLQSISEFFKTLMPEEQLLLAAEKNEENVHLSEKDEVYPWSMADKLVVSGNASSEDARSKQSPETSGLSTMMATRPNLLALKPTLGGLVVVDEIKSAADRLMLLGGLSGYIDLVMKDQLRPDIKTFTLLLDCIPATITAEENLLQEMERSGVDADVAFFNALIYRRSKRHDYESGFAVLDLMKERRVEIDVITVQSLAYCCSTRDSFTKYLNDVMEAGFSLSPPLLGAVLKNALDDTNFGFIHFVMDTYMHNEVRVHKGTLRDLEEFYTKNVRILQGKDAPPKRMIKFCESDYFKTGTKLFCAKFADWKRRITIEESSETGHWEQFRKSGKEAKELEPHLQRWRKGSRYAKAEWRKNKPGYIPPVFKK